MCRQVTCRTCGRPTWAGCGAHIEQVLGDVPPADRCHCKGAPGARHGVSGSKRTTPKRTPSTRVGAAVASEDAPKKRWWQR